MSQPQVEPSNPPPLEILFENEKILAINKPAGISTIKGRGSDSDFYLKKLLEDRVEEPLWVIHRLDKPVSGVLLFARDAETHRLYNRLFEEKSVKKRYVALVYGEVPDKGTITLPIAQGSQGKMRSLAGGKPSLTLFSKISGCAQASLLNLEPHTGRRHQLRVHCAYSGFPILFDRLYWGKQKDGLIRLQTQFERDTSIILKDKILLHAAEISFPDDQQKQILLSAPLPDYFKRAVDYFAQK